MLTNDLLFWDLVCEEKTKQNPLDQGCSSSNRNSVGYGFYPDASFSATAQSERPKQHNYHSRGLYKADHTKIDACHTIVTCCIT